MEPSEIRKRVIETIQEIKQLPDFDASMGLIESGLIDSFDIINMITNFEEVFGVSIDGDDLVPENFSTVEEIVRMIVGKLGK